MPFIMISSAAAAIFSVGSAMPRSIHSWSSAMQPAPVSYTHLFGSRLMIPSGVYLSPVYDGAVSPVRLYDEFGAVDIYLLPFLRPSQVRRFFPEEEIETYTAVSYTHLSNDLSNK